MRSAEWAKMWEAIKKSPTRYTKLESFSFANISGLQDGTLNFQSPMTAICGVNGTGKSSVLRALWATLDGNAIEDAPEISERIREATAVAHLEVGGERFVCGFPVSDEIQSASVLHIDPSPSAVQLQRRACELNELGELLESISPVVLSKDDVAILSVILRKDYEKIEISEVEEYSEEDPIPIISVTEHGRTYDVRTMSLGEISVFVIFWKLSRATKNSIILLEEPETFLSPVSQGSLMDYLAMVCVRKQFSIVLTTHSPQMFARLDPEQVKFLYRTPMGATLASSSQYGEMRKAVGIDPVIDRIFLVEDRAARELAFNLLRKLDRSLLLRSEIVDVGGHANVTGLSASFPKTLRSFRAIGVYDGDMRGKLDSAQSHVFLPAGTVEGTFKVLVKSQQQSFASRIGRSLEDVSILAARISGVDHHDWFEELGRGLSIGYQELMHACFEEWISDEDNRSSAEAFVSDLKQIAV